MKNSIIYNILLASVLFLIISGCKKDDIDWYRPIGDPLFSSVKFVNTIPNSRLDFYTYTLKVKSGVRFSVDDSAYVKTSFGNIQMNATNFNNTSSRITVNTTAATPQMNGQGLVPNYYQTMFACKSNDSTAAETMILLRDDLTMPASGKAHIRFVHLAQRGATKFRRVDFNAKSGPAGPATIFGNLSYQVPSNSVRIIPSDPKNPGKTGLNTPGLGPFTSGPFTPIDPGTYEFEVAETGSNTPITALNFNVKAGGIYTFYTSGIISGTPSDTLKYIVHLPITK